MITAGQIEIEQTVRVDYIPAPSEAEWALILADYDRAARRSPGIYSEQKLRDLVASGSVAVYVITSDGTRLGSFALEVATSAKVSALNVVWLTVRAGTFARVVRDAVLGSWKQVADAMDIQDFTIVGRTGWEHVLVAAGLKPKELARFWAFSVRNIQ